MNSNWNISTIDSKKAQKGEDKEILLINIEVRYRPTVRPVKISSLTRHLPSNSEPIKNPIDPRGLDYPDPTPPDRRSPSPPQHSIQVLHNNDT